MRKEEIKKLSFCALFGALGFVLMLAAFPIPTLIPFFIEFDISELPALIMSFVYGPLYGVLVCLLKNVLHLFVSKTAGVGEVSNFILGAIFVGVSGLIYKYKKDRKIALIGCTVGAFVMAVISIPANYYVVYPIYANIMTGMSLENILGIYKAILPSVDGLFEALVIFNLPFNFAKGIIDAAICFLIYKKLSPILKK